jgi:hypothetical protein
MDNDRRRGRTRPMTTVPEPTPDSLIDRRPAPTYATLSPPPHHESPSITDVELVAIVRALERRVAELERNEHGHCTQCGKPTPTGCMTHCSPDTPCPKAKVA